MAALRTTDFGHRIGLNEAGFKGLVVAALQLVAAGVNTVSVRSEVAIGRGFADLLVSAPGQRVVLELKYVPAGFAGTSEAKNPSALVNRDAIQRQVVYLKSLAPHELERLLVNTGNGVTRTVAQLCEDALSQATRYAYAMAQARGQEPLHGPSIRAVAIVGVGPRVLLRTGAVASGQRYDAGVSAAALS